MDQFIEFEEVDEETGDEVTHRLPAIYAVCNRCRGSGKHCNPNIDGNGITSDEWDEWGDDERETYLTGGYDVTCHECGGKRVILEIDEEECGRLGLTPILDRYWKMKSESAADYASERFLRYAESGGYDY
jgi:hypothetical protein